MKQFITFLLTCIACCGYAQQYPITSINITMPASPPANTADWGTAMPPVMITAQSQLRNGQVNGDVVESKILLTIKQGGSKICGSYTINTPPASVFLSAIKNLSGNNAVSLLGQNCTIQPGSYELCVQFFSGPSPSILLSAEVLKTFIINKYKEQIPHTLLYATFTQPFNAFT